MEIEKKKSKSTGGFQSMGLSKHVLQGILHKGFKVPTPIQRKAIPAIMTGVDVIAMARTGSGKTAAYLVPIIEKLGFHSEDGVRSIVICPTRELALQTVKVFNELTFKTNLRASLIIGGSKLYEQFENLEKNPDIIVATPGRLTFILESANISLQRVDIVCFDEADMMFEQGFSEQISDIVRLLPLSRQFLLFSATIPQSLGVFLKKTLKRPEIIRLDTEDKLSPDLENIFYHVKEVEKDGHLLWLLLEKIPKEEQTVIFCATRHEVEYLGALLKQYKVNSSILFGKADQQDREINLKKFRNDENKIMFVTDVAARGVDIPNLDNVINYDFPSSAKLYIHRCGRVARAGRIGTCYNFVQTEEMGYLKDLEVFAMDKEVPIGNVPREYVDPVLSRLDQLLDANYDLNYLKIGATNSMSAYRKSKPSASSEGVRKSKDMNFDGIHPSFNMTGDDKNRMEWLTGIKNYRPKASIFQIDTTKETQKQADVVKKLANNPKIAEAIRRAKEKKERMAELDAIKKNEEEKEKAPGYISTGPVKHSIFDNSSDRIVYSTKNPLDLAIEIAADEEQDLKQQAREKMWDRKKKKFIMASGGLEHHRREMKKKEAEMEQVKEKYKIWRKNQDKKIDKEKGVKQLSTKTKDEVLKKKMMKDRHEEQKKGKELRQKKAEQRMRKKK
ncbi:DEAD box ATP-dependent RNA helicase, putative [Entamoeba invadens IP1]|uniref:DEAD box ATP-dependent RNA helicase, putative n=1 Tax=Entamoeba invadens IP1 TaxID=370355 RepID=A0A0A1U8X3_ENTIV|nr:DEAD box ATP-dependent RNA helicase, putative [Entamoeba invadens IP1]ELP88433.1 DEAD box ATP-dependent RNA helicase, putative [Entamoeba invadens IP1]|eukprot:XP_004255204.1 DEAD box ATP-dependent RNA helicase, putative [Entamoeba invadens IP1]